MDNAVHILSSLWGGALRALLGGCVDSLRGTCSLFYIDDKINKKITANCAKGIKKHSPKTYSYRNGKVLKRMLQCCALNGGIFWLSLIIFDYTVIPFLRTILMTVFGYSTIGNMVWSWIYIFLTFTFRTIWVLPLFLLSKIVNGLWFQDIADSAFSRTQGRSQYFSSFSKFIADSFFSIIIQGFFLIQAMLMNLLPIPYIGNVLCVIHTCMLYSLYAFEYKWCKLGWELHQRLTFIESNWSYFIGFGLPLAILTYIPSSYVVSACVFSILFPLFIISANEARPITNTCDVHLRLFSLVIVLSNIIFNKTINRTVLLKASRT